MTPVRRLCLMALVALAPLPALGPPVRAAEPSPAYRAELRRTLELRKQRRRSAEAQPVGLIVPYPLPPVLIIRHTAEVHGEVEGLLGALRR